MADTLQYVVGSGILTAIIVGVVRLNAWMLKRAVAQNQEWAADKVRAMQEKIEGAGAKLCLSHDKCFDGLRACVIETKRDINKINQGLATMAAEMAAMQREQDKTDGKRYENIISLFKGLGEIQQTMARLEESLKSLKEQYKEH